MLSSIQITELLITFEDFPGPNKIQTKTRNNHIIRCKNVYKKLDFQFLCLHGYYIHEADF